MTPRPASDPRALKAVEALYSPAALPDPYPLYEAVRAHVPGGVLHLPEWNAAFLTGHAANRAALSSPLALSGQGMGGAPASDGVRLLQGMMLWRNGPDHRRLRGLVELAFTPRVVEEQRDLVRALVHDLLDAAQGREAAGTEVDLVAALAHPLPARVIMTMLGLGGGDEERFVRWSGSVAELLGGANQSAELLARIDAAAREMRAYFRDLAGELRARPRPGLLSALAAAQDGGERLSGDELLSNAVLLLTAGHETTSNLIPGGLLELAAQPAAWAALTADPRRPGVADELLRVVSPVQLDGRTLSGPLLLEGTPLPAGTQVQVMLAAANRDPLVFPDPARLDWTRPNAARHLAFAAGPHYCLGASLARLEITEVYAALAERFPRLRVLDPRPPFKPNPVLRGPAELKVRLDG